MVKFVSQFGLVSMDMQRREGEKKDFSLDLVVVGKMKKKKEDEGLGLGF